MKQHGYSDFFQLLLQKYHYQNGKIQLNTRNAQNNLLGWTGMVMMDVKIEKEKRGIIIPYVITTGNISR